MKTEILCKNPASLMRAFNKKAFLCVVENGVKVPCFNETMIAADLASASIEKVAKWAKKNGYTDATHKILQITPQFGLTYSYSIEDNAKK